MLTIHADNVLVPMNERGGEKIKNFWYILFFILIQALVLSEYLFSPKKGSDIFWFCNHASILYAYAYYKGHRQMVIGILQVGIVIQMLWLIGFMSHILGFEGITITSYMFEGSFNYAKIIALMVHMLLPIGTLWFVRKEKPRLVSLLYSAVYCVTMYISVIVSTPIEENVNCVFTPCTSLLPKWGYAVLWPIYTGMMVFLTHWGYRLIYGFFHREQQRVQSLYPMATK